MARKTGRDGFPSCVSKSARMCYPKMEPSGRAMWHIRDERKALNFGVTARGAGIFAKRTQRKHNLFKENGLRTKITVENRV
jgi:hypothetical protein